MDATGSPTSRPVGAPAAPSAASASTAPDADIEVHGAELRCVGAWTVARVARPLTVDNFEGLDARPGAPGESLLYLLSDDNFDNQQRTLLQLFALDDAPPVPAVDTAHAVCGP